VIKKEIKIFIAALTFFTRIPIPLSSDMNGGELLNRAAKYFPLVGWVVGAGCALVLWLSGFILPHSVSIVLSMAAGVIITGAFHEDGFADTCDGFGGGWNRERILDIMKDSRIGSYGSVGLVLILLTKYLVLAELPFWQLPLLLIAAHSISRLASTYSIYTHAYVGNLATSKAKPLCSEVTKTEIAIATFWGVLPLFFLGNYWLLLTIIPVFVAKGWLSHYFKRWIGGYTGDCLGAIQQVTEIVFYVAVLIIIGLKV
jgi:adenosylcobinamide-GDP ribazoletransferase